MQNNCWTGWTRLAPPCGQNTKPKLAGCSFKSDVGATPKALRHGGKTLLYIYSGDLAVPATKTIQHEIPGPKSSIPRESHVWNIVLIHSSSFVHGSKPVVTSGHVCDGSRRPRLAKLYNKGTETPKGPPAPRSGVNLCLFKQNHPKQNRADVYFYIQSQGARRVGCLIDY